MSRKIKDDVLTVTTAHPAQDADNASTAIDLGAATPWPSTESFQFEIAAPATAALANDQTLTYAIQDSANGTDFAAVAALATLVRTGAGGTGAAAVSRIVQLPPSVRRYVRVTCAASATAGNNTGTGYTARLLF